MTKKEQEQVIYDEQFFEIFHMMNNFFKDYKKSLYWMQTPNPNLGGSMPIDMINTDRFHKLKEFVEVISTGF